MKIKSSPSSCDRTKDLLSHGVIRKVSHLSFQSGDRMSYSSFVMGFVKLAVIKLVFIRSGSMVSDSLNYKLNWNTSIRNIISDGNHFMGKHVMNGRVLSKVMPHHLICVCRSIDRCN